uniref:Uncharacterized protein n=1 Tax=Ciona savignyi TaxID=51511 RepID=H2YRR1_CIOSA
MLPAFTEHLNDVGTADYEALMLRMRCIVQLTEHQTICYVVAHSNKVMENISAALERCVKSIKSGLSNPCAMEETLQLTAKIIRLKRISPFCESLALLLHSVVIKSKETGLLTKCLSVMSLCMEGSVERTKAVYDAHGNGLVKQLYKLMKHSDFAVVTYSLKIMCFIGQSFHAAIEYYTTLDKDYTVLRHLLMNSNSEGTSYVNQSHAAMLFGVIAQLPNGLEPILRVNKHGDLVRHLLVLCRDSNSKHCKANCAITLGKMAQGNTRFLEELRKHDGINILARNKPPEELLE